MRLSRRNEALVLASPAHVPAEPPPPAQEGINSDVSAGGGGRRRETATETAAKALPQTLRLASPLAAARLPSRRRGARWLGGAGAQPASRRDPSTGGHASSSSEEGAGERGTAALPRRRARLFLDAARPFAALPWALPRQLGINKRFGRAESRAGLSGVVLRAQRLLRLGPGQGSGLTGLAGSRQAEALPPHRLPSALPCAGGRRGRAPVLAWKRASCFGPVEGLAA